MDSVDVTNLIKPESTVITNISAPAQADIISFAIVPESPEDIRLIMEWRNDQDTRRNSFHDTPVQCPDFFNQFKIEYCADPTLPCLFAILNGQRIGFLRFCRIVDPQERMLKACDISINVAPQYRGRGLGSKIIQSVLPLLRSRGIETVLAEVKIDNKGSIDTFAKAGFQIIDEIDHLVVDTGKKFLVKRMIHDLITPVAINNEHIIAPGNKCFIIAEAGSNWRVGSPERDLKMAEALIDVAVEAGADAVKFQTYRPESTYVPNAGASDYLSHNGINESINKLFADLSMPYEMIPLLAKYCQSRNILFMSSPFSIADLKSVDPFVQIHKIASYEISHLRLLEAVAETGKPLILSSGASNLKDIAWAIEFFKSRSQAPICLMQCTAKYPAPLSAMNLSVIPILKNIFGIPVGLSDHSRDPITAPSAAVALGANLIEKHFTLDNRLPGPDHAFALTPKELKDMVSAIRSTQEVVGTGVKHILPEEEELHLFARRALQATSDINVGDLLVEGGNFDTLRPGKQKRGIHPLHIEQINNKRATRKITIGEGIQHGDFLND